MAAALADSESCPDPEERIDTALQFARIQAQFFDDIAQAERVKMDVAMCNLGRTPQKAVEAGAQVVQLLRALGFIIHTVKSDLFPRQSDGEFLGASRDTIAVSEVTGDLQVRCQQIVMSTTYRSVFGGVEVCSYIRFLSRRC